MGCKAAKTTRNITNTFGPGTANEHAVQWWVKKFCKGVQCLEDEEHRGRPVEVGSNQLRAIVEAHPLPAALEYFDLASRLAQLCNKISTCLCMILALHTRNRHALEHQQYYLVMFAVLYVFPVAILNCLKLVFTGEKHSPVVMAEEDGG